MRSTVGSHGFGSTETGFSGLRPKLHHVQWMTENYLGVITQTKTEHHTWFFNNFLCCLNDCEAVAFQSASIFSSCAHQCTHTLWCWARELGLSQCPLHGDTQECWLFITVGDVKITFGHLQKSTLPRLFLWLPNISNVNRQHMEEIQKIIRNNWCGEYCLKEPGPHNQDLMTVSA